jgi:hypothetical protein
MNEPVAFAETTGPRRPPRTRDPGIHARVPLVLRWLSAGASLLAVVASALLWLAELTEASGTAALAGVSLLVTALLAGSGVPLLFGPLGAYLPARERRLGIALAGLLPVLCWAVACWPALAAALGTR